MKKRVISWLLCLALCLSMLPVAALAEDVQKPEGPASSMNEPEPEAEEKETPAPKPEEQPEENPVEQPEQEEPEQEQKEPSRKEPEAEVQPELMTVGNLFMPLALETSMPFSITLQVMQDDQDIELSGVLGVHTWVRFIITGKNITELVQLVRNGTIRVTLGENSVTVNGGTFSGTDCLYFDFTPEDQAYDVTLQYIDSEYDASQTWNLTFEKCTHPSQNERTGKCSQCGATLVAEINSATYYASLSEALDAAQTIDDCTITLLDDAGLSGDYTVTKGKFTIDLKTFSQGSGTINVAGTADVTVKNESAGQFEGNFCWSGADAKLTLAEGSAYAKLSVAVTGKTVADLLPGGCGYQVSGNWVSESGLNQTTIQSVLVKKAPFTVDDFSVNSSSYINVPFQISASVRSSNFPNGHIDFDYCLYIDDILKKTGKQNSYSRLYMDCTLEDGSQHTAKLVVSYNGYSVTKTLVLQAVACPHTIIGQTTGQCTVCNLQMAAYVLDKGKYVQNRRYYRTFKEALDNVWITLGTTDCTLGIFEDTTVSSAITRDLISQRHTLTLCLNGKTLECTGEALFRALKLWDLIIQGENGTLKANSSTGVINASSGASLTIYGPITITNTNQNGYGIYTQGSRGDLANVEIYADKGNSVGSLYVNGGKVRLNGGTAGKVKVQGLNSLFYVAGGGRAAVSGTVTVQGNGKLETGDGHNPVFEDDVTIKSDGWASLRQGEFRKTLKIEPGIKKTLRGLLYNGADDFYIGGVYQKNAKEQTEISADGENYVTIGRGHTHDYDDNGKCRYCDAEAEAKLYHEAGNYNDYEFGSFTTMLAKAQDYENSSLVLWKDAMLYSNATVTKGKFYISGGTKRLQSNGTAALVISGGDVQITEITVDRLKVKDTGKLTLNGGKYYAIDVTGSTYENYGKLLATNRAFKHQTNWESKASITNKSFDVTSTNAPKSVEKPPFDSVAVTPTIWTVDYGKPVTFIATVTRDDSSKTLSYQWYTVAIDGTKTAIEGETGETMTVNEAIGSYRYKCEVTCEDYTLSSNTVQLTVQRIDLSDAVLSATIQTRAYDGTTSAKIEDGSSLTLGNLTVPASAYTLSAVFADKNARENKNVTVTVTLTNHNYCFGYDANKQPIMEETFETTGTITKNTSHMEQTKTVDAYSGVAHTYTIDLDACLSNPQNLGFESYEITEKNIVVAKLIDANQVVLEGHSLKIPVNAVVTAPGTVAAKFTIAVACKNYSNVTILVRVETKDRSTVTATATPSKSKLTYGEKLGTITLSGKTTPKLEGTFAWQTPDAILDAGTYKDLVWKFIPVDYTYAEASGTAEITVKRAKLTDPAPVTLTIYNGWAGTYEAALPELPTLAKGLRFGDNAAYGTPVVSVDEYYSSGAELKTVNGKQGVSIPILKNETAKEGQVGTITVQYTSQNYEPVTLAINLVAKNRTVPTFILTADHDTLSGGGKVTLTLERGNLPDGAVVTVSGTDEAGNAVTLTDNDNGTYSVSLPNKTQTYTFTAVYDGCQTIAPKTGFTTVKVQQRSSGGGEPAKPSFPVKISNSGDGVAKVDKSYASAGAKVTITVTPGRNATVQRITVTDEDGERLKLTENRDGTYSFTMPSGTANVYVRFSGSGLPFADVPSGSWYYDDVAYVYDTGLMTGLTVTAFGPNLSTTRGMIVTILWRMENEPVAKHGCPFADVRRGSYYEQAIAWASENGIVTGFDSSTFAPDRAITREQLAAILFRFAAYRGMDAVTLRETLSSFQDQAAISVYAVSALNWAVGEGLMQGTGDKLEPTGNATRAQVAAMLRRFIQRNF